MLLAHKTWPQVEDYLRSSSDLIIPIGSVEQHGPTGLIGTDFFTASDIAKRVGEKKEILVAPSLNYGMASHHMGFPGTATLRPKTLISVIYDVVESYFSHGFHNIIFINGHGGNIATLQTAFCELKYTNESSGLNLQLINWWQLDEVQNYEHTHFDNESGVHATISEVSVTKYNQKEAFLNIENKTFQIEKPQTTLPLTPEEMRNNYSDGRMASNPGRSTYEHGKAIFWLAVSSIVQKL